MLNQRQVLVYFLLAGSIWAACGDSPENPGAGDAGGDFTLDVLIELPGDAAAHDDTGSDGGQDTAGEDTGGEDTGGEDTGGEDTGNEDTGNEDTGNDDVGEGCPNWYRDFDTDTYGDPATTLERCSQPAGYVDNDEDCRDDDIEINPDTEWFQDLDDDTYGNPDSVLIQCVRPDAFVRNDQDCDDTSENAADINPETEWFEDFDEDGFGNEAVSEVQCEMPEGYVLDDTDCNDDVPEINPDSMWYLDEDGDGFAADDAEPEAQCEQPSLDHVLELGDCNDENPDQNPDSVWTRDLDGDGFGDPAVSVAQCEEPDLIDTYVLAGGDCQDTGAGAVNVFPGVYTCPFSNTGTSCLDILEDADDAGDVVDDGAYVIDPDEDGEGEPFIVYCDMTTDGGGWTALLNPYGVGFEAHPTYPDLELSGNFTQGSDPSCTGSVPGYQIVQGWYGYSFGRCNYATVQVLVEWENALGATDVRFAALTEGTPHRAQNPYLNDFACDDDPDSDGTVDTSVIWDPDRDDICGERFVKINGVEVPYVVLRFENTVSALNGIECAYWNADDEMPDEPPYHFEEAGYYADCAQVPNYPTAPPVVVEDAIDADEDLVLDARGGLGGWPSDHAREAAAVWRLFVR